MFCAFVKKQRNFRFGTVCLVMTITDFVMEDDKKLKFIELIQKAYAQE